MDNFPISTGWEHVATQSENLHESICMVTTSKVQTKNGMRESVTLIDGNSVTHTITRIQHDTSGTSTSIEGQNSLDGNVHSRHLECLKHDLSHLFSVSVWVECSLSQKHRVPFGSNTKLVVECVMPHLFHVIPVTESTIFKAIFAVNDTSFRRSFNPTIGVCL